VISPKLLVVCGAFATAMLMAGAASAAAPAYCALYAREYATQTVQPSAAVGMLQSVQDQAYYRCLNQDEDPPLPQTSAYFGTDLAKPVKSASATPPLPTPAPPPTSDPAPKPTTTPVVKASTARAPTAAAAPYHGSGLTAWTPEWAAWCANNFPNSWDAKSGTILRYDSDTRELCK
jgi:hypothetical protein